MRNDQARRLRPPDELIYVGEGPEAFEQMGDEFLRHFVDIGGLKPDERVLDVGCGVGRMAIPLTGYLSEKGSYEGFDVVEKGVAWCSENITPRYPNFRFRLVDIFNKRYRPEGGKRAEEFVFPYEDESFDFVFLTSVFTHILPKGVRNYTSEVSRVLKPGGRCLATYFLLNEESLGLIEEGMSTWGFRHERGKLCRVVDPKQPERAVAYVEQFVRRLHRQNGLSLTGPVSYGSWCGRKEYLSHRDIVAAAKAPPSHSLARSSTIRRVRSGLRRLFDRSGERGQRPRVDSHAAGGGSHAPSLIVDHRQNPASDEILEISRNRGSAGSHTTNSRRRGDSTLLASFCNVREHKPVVAAIDLQNEQPEVRWIEIKGGAHVMGGRGLCYWNGLVCVAHQPGPRNTPAAPPSGFVFLDPDRDFEQVGEGILPSVPHSVCSKDGDLYFTMSREDAVYKATLNGRSREWEVSRHWTFPGSSGTEDENHVNAIEVVDGNLCISATGRKEKGSDLWASATRGFVYDLDRAEYVMNDLKQPHSLLEDSRTAWTCETRGSRIRSNKGDEYGFPGGYTWRIRGLAINEDHFYVGVSKNRLGSDSQGTLRGYEGACRVYRLAKGSKEPEALIDFSEDRNEIYELMLV